MVLLKLKYRQRTWSKNATAPKQRHKTEYTLGYSVLICNVYFLRLCPVRVLTIALSFELRERARILKAQSSDQHFCYTEQFLMCRTINRNHCSLLIANCNQPRFQIPGFRECSHVIGRKSCIIDRFAGSVHQRFAHNFCEFFGSNVRRARAT